MADVGLRTIDMNPMIHVSVNVHVTINYVVKERVEQHCLLTAFDIADDVMIVE